MVKRRLVDAVAIGVALAAGRGAKTTAGGLPADCIDNPSLVNATTTSGPWASRHLVGDRPFGHPTHSRGIGVWFDCDMIVSVDNSYKYRRSNCGTNAAYLVLTG